MKSSISILVLFTFLFSTIALSGPRLYPARTDGDPREKYIAHAKNGMIATAHPAASDAGLLMMKKGGNAVDAAVAASFVISVVRPQSTGIGGGGFMLSHIAKEKKTRVYDFRERAPDKATRDMYLDKKGNPKNFIYKGKMIKNASVNGHLSVGTPGLIAGLVKVHADSGKLPLSVVTQPAIELAEKGFKVYPRLSETIADRAAILTAFESSKEILFKNGKPLQPGELLVQKDLAMTLKRIARYGRDGFYKGPVADRIVAEMRRGGGIITHKDLANYKVKMREPIEVDYRGYRVVSMPPPSSGGIHIAQILNIISGDDVASYGLNTTKGVHFLAEAMRRAFADRAKYLGDPDFVKVPIKGLISKKYATKHRSSLDFKKATSSKEIGPGKPFDYESDSTTHLSVVDKDGNAVSSTQTVNYSFGSCVIAKGTGIVLNDEMDDFSKKPGVPNVFGLVGSEANAIAAKKTMLSSMSPTLVFEKDGKIKLVVGSPGGPRIINATLQTIINTIDHKLPLPDAVHAYRIHHQWLPDEIRIEPNGLTPKVIKELEAMGHKITPKTYPIGDVQAIARDKDGWIGVSDTRSDGHPYGY